MTIHPSAHIAEGARLAPDVEVGPFTIIHSNAIIEAGCVIGSHCEIGVPTTLGDGSPLHIGAKSNIRSHSIFYQSSQFGAGLVTGHRVTVRENTRAGESLQIGTMCDIQGHCDIGAYVRLHSNVHIGQGSAIENYIWIFPYVVLTNDPHPPSELRLGVRVCNFAVVATMSVLLPGVTIGEGALVAAGSCVTKDVSAHRVVAGNPAVDRGPTTNIYLKDGSNVPAYPWKNRFHRGYPEYLVKLWNSL